MGLLVALLGLSWILLFTYFRLTKIVHHINGYVLQASIHLIPLYPSPALVKFYIAPTSMNYYLIIRD